MAIIQCPKCKAIVKHDATTCHKCGYDLSQQAQAVNSPATSAESRATNPAPQSGAPYQKIAIGAMAVAIIALVIAVVMLIRSNSSNSTEERYDDNITITQIVDSTSPSTAGLFPHTSSRLISERELVGMTPRELKIMRNEIFARHGKIFKTKDMAEYFSLQNWYRAHAENVTLSEVEQFNVAVIKAYEDKLGAQNLTQIKPKKSAAKSGLGLFPFTSTRKLTYSDIAHLSDYELKIMRNEIYARHGYIFQSKDMKQYFSKQSWYRPTTTNVQLSSIEQYNVNFIKSYEQ